MLVKSQTGTIYEIWIISTEKNMVYCQAVPDKRKKYVLGQYSDINRATQVFNEIRKYTYEYYEMPLK